MTPGKEEKQEWKRRTGGHQPRQTSGKCVRFKVVHRNEWKAIGDCHAFAELAPDY
jgi:hypothetical protein